MEAGKSILEEARKRHPTAGIEGLRQVVRTEAGDGDVRISR